MYIHIPLCVYLHRYITNIYHSTIPKGRSPPKNEFVKNLVDSKNLLGDRTLFLFDRRIICNERRRKPLRSSPGPRGHKFLKLKNYCKLKNEGYNFQVKIFSSCFLGKCLEVPMWTFLTLLFFQDRMTVATQTGLLTSVLVAWQGVITEETEFWWWFVSKGDLEDGKTPSVKWPRKNQQQQQQQHQQ